MQLREPVAGASPSLRLELQPALDPMPRRLGVVMLLVEIRHHLAIRRCEGVCGTQTRVRVNLSLRGVKCFEDCGASVLLILVVMLRLCAGRVSVRCCLSRTHGVGKDFQPVGRTKRDGLALHVSAKPIRILLDPVQQGGCCLVGIGTGGFTRLDPSPNNPSTNMPNPPLESSCSSAFSWQLAMNTL